MPDILALFHCLHPLVTTTTIRHLSRIVGAILVMTGRITMLGISRWTGDGGSYRTVQRFFALAMPWAHLFWLFFRQHVYHAEDVYILAGDEVVVTKAGKQTHGVDRFFAGLYQTTVPGLAFFTLALVSTMERRAFPIRVEQVVRSDVEKAASKAKQAARKSKEPTTPRPIGRPKGSKNQPRGEVTLTPELQRIQRMLQEQRTLMAGFLPLTYLALDGHFGNNHALQMVRQCDLHLISKLRCDAALYLPYAGPYAGRGPRRKYGAKLDYRAIPDQYLHTTTVDGQIETRLYQVQALHKEFAQPLNVVIIVKSNRQTHARARVILFSSDLALSAEQLVDYYSLRFQLEFNFRDAKQYWGLEDFMNITAVAVTNAANLALFMVNVVYVVLRAVRQTDPTCSVLDLKTRLRGQKYVEETIKLLPEMPEPIVLEHIFSRVASLGRIHAADPRLNSS